ncbi:MAG: conserved membrane protein of unknown function [Promethearchaeota archaeon]|jgi:hypothetical protein|nr:MAG: conserved membrane protein of unknown function [Candidatus Lokiarchaeota archaeon]
MNETSKIRNLRKRIGLPLLVWGGINMLAAVFYPFSTSDLIKGILLQSFFWGLIDGILGLVTYLRKKEFNLERIKKILLVNTYLDIGYMVIGILLIILGGNAFLIGNGLGVIIQGLFLFVVDLIHYRHIKYSI